ncbi:hypothetical protein Tco_1473344 [Tanacetum coccineum]
MPRILIPLRPILGVLQIGIKSQGYREPVFEPFRSEDSTVTYTEYPAPHEDLICNRNHQAEGPNFQDPPSPDYVSALRSNSMHHLHPSMYHIVPSCLPRVLTRDDVLPLRSSHCPSAASPTTDSPDTSRIRT